MRENVRENTVAADAWRGRRVLVTGGSGFIGQHLLFELLARGAELTAVSRTPPADVNAPELVEDVRWRHLDLVDASAARSLLKDIAPQTVFHLAGMVTGTRDRSAVLPMLHANVAGLIALMDAAVDCGCERFIQAGSLEEPDDLVSPIASPYAASKLAASAYTHLYREHYGLATATARIFMVFGPGCQDTDKVVPYVIRSLLAGESPKLMGGQRPIDWIHVRDVARGLMALAESRNSRAELGRGELHSVRDMVTKIYGGLGLEAKLKSSPPFGAVEDRAAERVRCAQLESNQGIEWSPEISLDTGVAETVEWFRSRR